MTPYITFNGVSSADLGLRLVQAEPFILPTRNRKREIIPGRIGSIAPADFELPPIGYGLRLAATGASKGDVVHTLNLISGWVLSARVMTVWHEPGYYYTGAVEGDSSFSMLTKHHGQLELEFLCDPPCRHKALVTGGFVPNAALPIPEQMSDTVRTIMASAQTAAFTLDAGTVVGSLPPALYLRITGSWATMTIGSLTITEGSGSTTLYVDCEAQEVYKLVSGTRTPVRYTGDFPVLNAGKLSMGGTSLNITARLLVVERG